MPEQVYPWQAPFVCDADPIEPVRRGSVDIYAVDDERGPAPAVVFVHGGPLPPGLPVLPRDWPLYRGYAALAARAGLVAATFHHRLHSPQDYSTVHDEVQAAIRAARAEAVVDGSRVAVWAFSGGAPATAPLLRHPPNWLRCLALTYPVLDSTADLRLPDGYRLVEELDSETVPIVLTQVGREAPAVNAGIQAFLDRARQIRARLEVISLPKGEHGFDALPPVDGACAAVNAALDAVRIALTR